MNQKVLPWIVLALVIGLMVVFGFANFFPEKQLAKEDIPAVTKEDVPAATDDEAMALESISTKMVGTWESLDDSKYVLVLNGNDTYEEQYGDDSVGTGTWLLFTDPTVLGLDVNTGFTNNVFLEKKDNAMGESLHYNVVIANGDELTITYLARGNTLRFRRIK